MSKNQPKDIDIYSHLQQLEQIAEQREKEKRLAKQVKKGLDIQFIIDTREKDPFFFSRYPSCFQALKAGDYSVSGFEHKISIERKSLDDYVSTIIHNRDRFRVELEKLQTYDYKAIVVEANLSDITNQLYTSQAHPNSILGLTIAITMDYQIPVLFLSNHQLAGDYTERLLIRWALNQEKKEVDTK